MQLPDGTTLMHGRVPYDPVKAHQYYLRTRKLKGRSKGAVPPKTSTGGDRKPTFTVRTSDGKTTYKLTSQQLAEQKHYADVRIQAIKHKLVELNTLLSKKMAEARASDAKAKRGPTAADKAKVARDSKKYRDKHKTALATKAKRAATKNKTSSKHKANSVEALHQQIHEIKKSLTAAVARQKALATATKNG